MAQTAIVRLRDSAAIAEEAASRLARCAESAVERRGRFVVALSGGSTPRQLHGLLSRPPHVGNIDWRHTTVLFGDERSVAPDHEQSNYRMAKETLFDRVPLSPWRIHRMRGEAEPAAAAAEYQQRMQALFADDDGPRVDLVLLGMGPDGHTASLFPGTEALHETSRWVVANHVPRMDTWRITLTLPALNAARNVLFMIAGREKAPVFAEAFACPPKPWRRSSGKHHDAPHPCERVVPTDGTLTVLVDEAAAGAQEREPE